MNNIVTCSQFSDLRDLVLELEMLVKLWASGSKTKEELLEDAEGEVGGIAWRIVRTHPSRNLGSN